MNTRNLSPQRMFQDMAARHVPEFQFSRFQKDFSEWKAAAKPRVLQTLGDWPEAVDPNPRVITEWVDRGVHKRRIVIDVAPHVSANLQINLPEKRPASLPGILCWHGHGPYGKEPVMGNEKSDEMRRHIRELNYDYGHQMAAAGFATFAIDWIGAGERNDSGKPHFLSHNSGRDWCNLYYLHATMLGMTSLSINLAHGRAVVDYVSSLPEIDASRLGVMGLSGGGTMTLWSALTDERLRAAEIICYSDLWSLFGIRDLNYCGMQVAPGLYKLVDLPDLQGLLAPLPLLVDIGIHDECFQSDNALACYHQVEAIYKAAGASSNLELDLFPGNHSWGANKSVAFFSRHLQ